MNKTITLFLKSNKIYIFRAIESILFFLLGINFFDLQLYIFIALFILVSIEIFLKRHEVFCIFKNKVIDFSLLIIFFLLCVILKSIWNSTSVLQNIFHFLIIPFVFISIGLFDIINGKKNSIIFLIAYFLGAFLLGFLDMGMSFAQFGFFSSQRLSVDLWNGSYVAATGVSIMIIPFVFFAIGGIFLYKKNLKSIFLSLLILLSIIISISLQNRGFFLSFIIGGFLFLFLSFRQLENQKKINKFLIIVSCIFLFFFLIYLLIIFNVFNLYNFLSNIPFFERVLSGGSDSSRIKIYQTFFSIFYKYPFGNMPFLEESSYVHNLWLDIYAEVGIFPFLIFLYFTLRILIELLIKNSIKIDFKMYIFYSSIILGIFSISLIEPTFDANMYFFGSISTFIVLVICKGNIKNCLINKKNKNNAINSKSNELLDEINI